MKERLLLIILAFFCLTFQTQGQSLQPGHVILGDANGDGVVNVADIVEVANYINGIPSKVFSMKNADINRDGSITEEDLLGIVNVIMSENPQSLIWCICAENVAGEVVEIPIDDVGKIITALEGTELSVYDKKNKVIAEHIVSFTYKEKVSGVTFNKIR